MHVFIYPKGENNHQTFLYYKILTLSKKQDNFRYIFYIQKASYFYFCGFWCKFWIWYLYTKIMALCVMWPFLYRKHDTYKKDIICVTFLYTKARTLCVTLFLLNFWNCRRGGGSILYFFLNNALWVTFLFAKSIALCVTFLYTKSLTFCVTFILYKKQCTLCYVFITKIYRIVLIPNYLSSVDVSE